MNLLVDHWIPTETGTLASIEMMLDGELSICTQNPILRLAIFRLLQAIDATPPDLIIEEYFDLYKFLQMGGLPESAKNPIELIQMVDGNSVAFSPKPSRKFTEIDLARGLVFAYFCDRGGFKARMVGLPISAKVPIHVGQRIRYIKGKNCREMLDLNKVAWTGLYSPPWVSGFMDIPKHEIPIDNLELLMWPWRRLMVTPNGISIYPGATIVTGTIDPWSVSKSKMSDLTLEPEEGFEFTSYVLNQSLPIACWIS